MALAMTLSGEFEKIDAGRKAKHLKGMGVIG
jgi:hypothetical protein